MGKKVTYRGNCHCARYRFEVNLPEIKSAIFCNCVPCSKTGIFWAFPADQADFTVTRDDGLLTSTHYGGSLEHKIRTLLGVNPFLLQVEQSIHPDATVPATVVATAITAALPSGDDTDGLVTYTGSCTCGAIAVALRTRPLAEVEVKEDNCSTCVRSAYVGVYPDKSQVTATTPNTAQENTEDDAAAAAAAVYVTPPGFSGARFCHRCGVRVWSDLYGPPAELVATWPEARRAVVERKLRIRPLNVRVLDGVEWDRLNILRSDEGTEGYVVE